MPCPHTACSSDLRVERHRVRRVYKCLKCKRIVRRTRSRWANRRDRRRQYVEAARPRGWRQADRFRNGEDLHERALRGPAYAKALIAEMEALTWQAKQRDQEDDRNWKYAPEAIRFRRLLRRWWALPAKAVQGVETPTSGLYLTQKGRLPKHA